MATGWNKKGQLGLGHQNDVAKATVIVRTQDPKNKNSQEKDKEGKSKRKSTSIKNKKYCFRFHFPYSFICVCYVFCRFLVLFFLVFGVCFSSLMVRCVVSPLLCFGSKRLTR